MQDNTTESPPSRPADAKVTGDIDVSVVVVNYNTARLLPEMHRAVTASQGGMSLEWIIVDNASRDDSVSVLHREFPDAHIILNPRNVGFGRANNQAIPYSRGRHVLLLNTDAFVAVDTLARTMEYMDTHPECGVLGVRLVGRDGSRQPSRRFFPNPWNVFLARSGLASAFPKVQMVDPEDGGDTRSGECDWVVGCYMLIRRDVIEQCGLFDPRYFLYLEEVDFCRRVKQAGWKVIHFAETTVIHLGGESAKNDAPLTSIGRQISSMQIESELLYYRKNFGISGLGAFVLLSLLTDLIHAIKWLLRRRSLSGLKPIAKHAVTLHSFLWKTRAGSMATR